MIGSRTNVLNQAIKMQPWLAFVKRSRV